MNIIKKYRDLSNPGSFSGLSGFIKNNKYTPSKVKKALNSLPEYTLHAPIKYKFPRSKTLVSGIDKEWQVDLVDVNNISKANSNYKYILTCIDVFSKHAWAIPIINKSSKSTISFYDSS